MEASGIAVLREETVADQDMLHTRYIDMRFSGQAFQLMFEVPQPFRSETLVQTFRELYRRRYGHDHREEMEIVNLRVSSVGVTRKPELSGFDTNDSAKARGPRMR